MKKAVLFDFDGVIADTEMKTLAYTEELFFKYGAVFSQTRNSTNPSIGFRS